MACFAPDGCARGVPTRARDRVESVASTASEWTPSTRPRRRRAVDAPPAIEPRAHPPRIDSVRVTQSGRRARTTQATKCRVNSVFPSFVQNGDRPTLWEVPLVSYRTSFVTSYLQIMIPPPRHQPLRSPTRVKVRRCLTNHAAHLSRRLPFGAYNIPTASADTPDVSCSIDCAIWSTTVTTFHTSLLKVNNPASIKLKNA